MLVLSSFAVWADAPDTLQVASVKDYSDFDPTQTKDMDYTLVILNIYEELVSFQLGPDYPNVVYAPELAESYEISDDGLVWTFHLREGVMFHGGYGEMTSEDVKFCFERMMDPDYASPHTSNFNFIESVSTPDRYTVVMRLDHPSPGFIGGTLAFRGGQIYSKKAFEEMGDEEFGKNPIGTGAYAYAGRVVGEKIMLVRHEEYWGEKPAIKNIVINIIPDDMTAAGAMVAGDIDYMYLYQPETVKFLTDSPRATVMSSQGEGLGFAINMERLTDVRVRAALLYAVDREAIMNEVYFGAAAPIRQTLLPPAMAGYETGVKKYDYDPAKARQLLAEAGYEDGELKIRVVGREQSKPMTTACTAYWTEIGVDVNLDIVTTAGYGEAKKVGDWDLLVTTPTRPDASLLLRYFYGPNSPTPNLSRYKNPKVDSLIEEYMQTPASETEKLLGLLYEIQMQISIDLPRINMIDINSTTATRSCLIGDCHNTFYRLMFYPPLYWDEDCLAK